MKRCPNCSAYLPPASITANFACGSCRAQLRSNVWWVMLPAVVVVIFIGMGMANPLISKWILMSVYTSLALGFWLCWHYLVRVTLRK